MLEHKNIFKLTLNNTCFVNRLPIRCSALVKTSSRSGFGLSITHGTFTVMFFRMIEWQLGIVCCYGYDNGLIEILHQKLLFLSSSRTMFFCFLLYCIPEQCFIYFVNNNSPLKEASNAVWQQSEHTINIFIKKALY